MPSEATNSATRREWRELGFFHDRDDQNKLWKLTGSRAGLLRFRDALLSYVGNRELTRYSGSPWEQVSVENGINLKVIWFDEVEDLLEVVFSCSNGFFSGQAEIYVSCDDLSEFADSLTRFPSRPDDSRDFELGTFNPDHADGGARMHFFCADAAGHAVVKVKLRGDACRALGEMQSVALRIPIQAAGVDEFVNQLRGIGKTLGASAHLPQAVS